MTITPNSQLLPSIILQKLLDSFKNDFNLTPCIGAELEFYLLPLLPRDVIASPCNGRSKPRRNDEFLLPHEIATPPSEAHKEDLLIQSQLTQLEKNCNIQLKLERGLNQYEIEIAPSTDIISYPAKIKAIRRLIAEESIKLGFATIFDPKPFPNDFGSSMHIHFNFLEDNNAEKYAEILCHYLPSTIDAFLPNREDYSRLDMRFMAPTHISYGGNNRTTLVRIPDSRPKRIEHRLPGANADPYKVIYTILSSIHEGLKYPSSIPRLAKTHGNAYDEQYGLVRIMDL